MLFCQLLFRLRMQEAEQATSQLSLRYADLEAQFEGSTAQLEIERSEARDARRKVGQIRSESEARIDAMRAICHAKDDALKAKDDALKAIKEVGLFLASIAIAIFLYFFINACL